MTGLLKNRVLISGIASPLAALVFYELVYITLTWRSADREKDWLFRLSLSTLAMVVPFLVTLILAIKDRRRNAFSLSTKIGLALAILSLGLTWSPISDALTRSKQVRNQAMHDVLAPHFGAQDIFGRPWRLEDHKGEVVLVNIWATWCGPCRKEMPKLDQLYQRLTPQGFTVVGLSEESFAVQRKFIQDVPVTYPLLKFTNDIPALYRDIARYPAIFLIDREGRLHPAPGPEEPFDKTETLVNSLIVDRPR